MNSKKSIITVIISIFVMIVFMPVCHALTKCFCDGKIIYTNTICPCEQIVKDDYTKPADNSDNWYLIDDVARVKFLSGIKDNDAVAKCEIDIVPIMELSDNHKYIKNKVRTFNLDKIPVTFYITMVNTDNNAVIDKFSVDGEMHKNTWNRIRYAHTLNDSAHLIGKRTRFEAHYKLNIYKAIDQKYAIVEPSNLTSHIKNTLSSEWKVVSVKINQRNMRIVTDQNRIDRDTYIRMVRAVCSNLIKYPDAASQLREIRFLNRWGRQGWVFEAPHRYKEIISAPDNDLIMTILSHTHLHTNS